MNPAEPSSNNASFTDLSEVPPARSVSTATYGNVIRDVVYQPVRYDDFRNDPGRPNEPQVVVHRNGDDIAMIEFRCSCGCSKTVRFDYEGE